MNKALPPLDQLEVDSYSSLLNWLHEHHAQEEGVLLVTYKKHVIGKYVSRENILDAVIAHGWVDGRRWSVDAAQTMQLISPRRTMVWARSYKLRADQLVEKGLMHSSGLEAISKAKTAGVWNVSDPIDDLKIPEVLYEALWNSRNALDYFQACPPAYKRNILRWLHKAKARETQNRRASEIALACSQRIRIKNF